MSEENNDLTTEEIEFRIKQCEKTLSEVSPTINISVLTEDGDLFHGGAGCDLTRKAMADHLSYDFECGWDYVS